MTRFLFLTGILIFAVGATTVLGEPRTSKKDEKDRDTQATFLVTGLHCPPCTKTVESSLSKVKGIRSIQVDWKAKDAQIEFDEAVLPAQRVAKLIADTPHMMGRNMQYGGWLLLKVADIKDEATAKPVKEALSKVEGVKRVVAYPKQHAVGVEFGTKGDLTTKQLIEALKKAGLSAKT